MFKIIVFILMLCSYVYAGPGDVGNCSKIDAYILIHGIGGSSDSFAYLAPAIESNVSCSTVYEFNYHTEKDELIIFDFAKKLEQYIENNIDKETNINFIMHSQGGLVGLTWLINSFYHAKGFEGGGHTRLKKFISLSTPFWGSDFAWLGEQIFFGGFLNENRLSPFGKRQLESMNYGSEFYFSLKEYFTNDYYDDFQSYLKNHKGIYNIKAVFPYINSFLSKLPFPLLEGDVVVNTPSMSMNFIDRSQQEHSYAKELYVEGIHFDIYRGLIFKSVVGVPRSCVSQKNCGHEGFNTVLSIIENRIVSSRLKNTTKGFEGHIQVIHPKETSLELEVEEHKDIFLSLYRFNILKISPITSFVTKNHAVTNYLIKGSVISDTEVKSMKLSLKVDGIQPTKISMNVKKGMVSFSKIDLSE